LEGKPIQDPYIEFVGLNEGHFPGARISLVKGDLLGEISKGLEREEKGGDQAISDKWINGK